MSLVRPRKLLPFLVVLAALTGACRRKPSSGEGGSPLGRSAIGGPSTLEVHLSLPPDGVAPAVVQVNLEVPPGPGPNPHSTGGTGPDQIAHELGRWGRAVSFAGIDPGGYDVRVQGETARQSVLVGSGETRRVDLPVRTTLRFPWAAFVVDVRDERVTVVARLKRLSDPARNPCVASQRETDLPGLAKAARDVWMLHGSLGERLDSEALFIVRRAPPALGPGRYGPDDTERVFRAVDALSALERPFSSKKESSETAPMFDLAVVDLADGETDPYGLALALAGGWSSAEKCPE
ncbi:MAG TPA: hypothetical protein VHE30_11735 [Polyangiaceae bacterium]|nr:hypothetical protein [Polyangiaceae bacterium]